MKKWHVTLLITCMTLVISLLSGCGGGSNVGNTTAPTVKTNPSGSPSKQTKTTDGGTTPAAPPVTTPVVTPAKSPSAPPTPSTPPVSAALTLTKPATTALPPAFRPDSIGFSNADDGVIVGTTSCPNGQCQSEIATTQDGGRTWTAVAQINRLVGGLSVEGNDVYASAQDDSGTNRLLVSEDGGRTWNFLPNQQKVAGSRTYHAITTVPCTGGMGVTALSYPTEQKGWALCNGQGGAGRMGKAIYATTDGGSSWQSMLQVPFDQKGTNGGIGSNGYPQGIFFLEDGHGWLWEARGNLYATTDGGRNWQYVSLTQPESIEAKSVWFLSDSTGFVLRSNYEISQMQLMKTEDGGKSWLIVDTWKYS